MPEATMPHKRVLVDTNQNARNGVASDNALKKRKLENQPSSELKPPMASFQRKGFGSSQPQKSQFESEVLEKFTQDIGDLKENNAEKDQQWERPSLPDWDSAKENVCFQQIDAEEGRLPRGDVMAVRLFGVTEVCLSRCETPYRGALNLMSTLGWSISFASRHRIPTLPLHCRSRRLHRSGL